MAQIIRTCRVATQDIYEKGQRSPSTIYPKGYVVNRRRPFDENDKIFCKRGQINFFVNCSYFKKDQRFLHYPRTSEILAITGWFVADLYKISEDMEDYIIDLSNPTKEANLLHQINIWIDKTFSIGKPYRRTRIGKRGLAWGRFVKKIRDYISKHYPTIDNEQDCIDVQNILFDTAHQLHGIENKYYTFFKNPCMSDKKAVSLEHKQNPKKYMKAPFEKKDAAVAAFAANNTLSAFVEKYVNETYATETTLTEVYNQLKRKNNTLSPIIPNNNNMQELETESAVEATEIPTVKKEKPAKAAKIAKAPKAVKEPAAPKPVRPAKEPAPAKGPTKADAIRELLLQGKTPSEIMKEIQESGAIIYPSEITGCLARMVKKGQIEAPVRIPRQFKKPQRPENTVVEEETHQEAEEENSTDLSAQVEENHVEELELETA
jgi:hypothetical protein